MPRKSPSTIVQSDPLDSLLSQADAVPDALVADWLRALRRGERAASSPPRRQPPPDVYGHKETTQVEEKSVEKK
jgi:hypothetical protein